MPLMKCSVEGRSGWKWGNSGKCYVGARGRSKALRQARAIASKRKNVFNARPNPLKRDPSRTATLRRTFENDLKRRLKRLRAKILKLVYEEDVFGLKRTSRGVFNLLLFNTKWKFNTDEQKLREFQEWLASEIETELSLRDEWFAEYVEAGYRKGAGRAFDEVRKPAISSNLDFFLGTKDQFLRTAFAHPESIAKTKLLVSRTFTDLKGVTEAMSTAMTRTLADGFVQGKNARVIARELNKNVESLGRNRSLTIARTEVIRAHAEGQLDTLERLGIQKVGVAVEWSTTGDDRVCPLCVPLEGVVMSLKEARGTLPRHPNCRCAFIPANVDEALKGQKKSQQKVQKGLDDSVRAEIPKSQKGKISLKQQKKASRWPGAEKDISKDRPHSLIPTPSKPFVEKPTNVPPTLPPKPTSVKKSQVKQILGTPRTIPELAKELNIEPHQAQKVLIKLKQEGLVSSVWDKNIKHSKFSWVEPKPPKVVPTTGVPKLTPKPPIPKPKPKAPEPPKIQITSLQEDAITAIKEDKGSLGKLIQSMGGDDIVAKSDAIKDLAKKGLIEFDSSKSPPKWVLKKGALDKIELTKPTPIPKPTPKPVTIKPKPSVKADVTKPKVPTARASTHKQWKEGLSVDESNAISEYTGSGYRRIRKCMNKGINCTEDIKKTIRGITSALDKAPEISRTVYRGIGFEEEQDLVEFLARVERGEIGDKGFMSTSLDRNVAEDFMVDTDYRVMMKIEAKSGADISSLSQIPKEEEILFGPKAKFQVRSVKRVANRTGERGEGYEITVVEL